MAAAHIASLVGDYAGEGVRRNLRELWQYGNGARTDLERDLAVSWLVERYATLDGATVLRERDEEQRLHAASAHAAALAARAAMGTVHLDIVAIAVRHALRIEGASSDELYKVLARYPKRVGIIGDPHFPAVRRVREELSALSPDVRLFVEDVPGVGKLAKHGAQFRHLSVEVVDDVVAHVDYLVAFAGGNYAPVEEQIERARAAGLNVTVIRGGER